MYKLKTLSTLSLLLFSFSLGQVKAGAPEYPVDLLQQGLEAFMDERYEDSIHIFQRILNIDKYNEAAKKGIKNAQKKREAQIEKIREKEGPALKATKGFMKKGHWVKAYDRLQVILSRVPDHPVALRLKKKMRSKLEKLHSKAKNQSSDWFFTQGVLAYFDRDWFKAVSSWEHVYAFNPDMISLVEQIDKAKSNLKIQQTQERIDLYNTIAWDSLNQGHYKKAIVAWEDLLKIDGRNKEALEGIKEAKSAYREARQRNRHERVQQLSEKAMDAYIDRDYKKSLKLWNKILNIDPNNSLAVDYKKRIRGRGESMDYAASSGDYDYESSQEKSGYKKALKFIEEERYVEAMEYLERYVENNADDPEGKAALELTRQKQKELAEKAYKQGLMSYSDEQPNQAIKFWQDALRIDPEFQRARQALIKTLAEQKK